MIDRLTIEMTLIQIARQKRAPLDGHAPYNIRTGVAQALQAKECYRQRMTATEYQWEKPAAKRWRHTPMKYTHVYLALM